MRYSLNRVLSSQHYEVQEAPSGEEGVAAVKKQAPDVVLLDLQLPDMSGVEFLQRVKRMYPGVARVILSGSGDFRTATAAINLGEVHKYFVKGRDDDLLSGEVRKLLLQRNPARSAA